MTDGDATGGAPLPPDALSALEMRLGHVFADRGPVRQALTHSSRSGSGNNERLEFLGDRVLNLTIAEALYVRFPSENEGSLARRHSALVQGKTLALVAGQVSLGAHIVLSDGERLSGGAKNENILSDAMEAVIAAVFLDGGFPAARDVILRLWAAHLDMSVAEEQDPKTALQELVQGRGLPLPEYQIIGRSGPDHAPRFEVELKVRNARAVIADGPSRRAAEKAAASLMLAQLKEV